MTTPPIHETITLGGGCFWCVEAVFEQVDGVVAVESGYSNGHVLNPSYEAVCTGTTGHNEVVRVTFDPQRITLADVLEIFFVVHDPTTLNRQGNDVGTQYRSAIYTEHVDQEPVVRAVIHELQAALREPVVTEVQSLRNYSRAEAYHQHYFAQHPGQGYCAAVIAPKVEKFRRNFAARVRR
jgi:peptide-methionine (S)-S-oxide reductase